MSLSGQSSVWKRSKRWSAGSNNSRPFCFRAAFNVMDAVQTYESIFQSFPNLLSKKFRWHPRFLSSVCLKPTFSWILLGASFRLVPVTLAGLANTYSQAGNFCGVFALWCWTLLHPVILMWMVTQPHKNQSDSTRFYSWFSQGSQNEGSQLPVYCGLLFVQSHIISQACDFWQRSLKLIQRLLKAKTREVKQKRLKHSTELKENSLHMRYFWMAQQQFFRQFLCLGGSESFVPDGIQYENNSTSDVGDQFCIFLPSAPYFCLDSDASCNLLDPFQIDLLGTPRQGFAQRSILPFLWQALRNLGHFLTAKSSQEYATALHDC